MRLSGIKDVDRIILNKLEDTVLFQVLSLNEEWNKICDDNFFYQRLKDKYPHLYSSYSKNNNNKNVKEYYIHIMKIINKLKEEFDFNFTTYGDPEEYYEILSQMRAAENIKIETFAEVYKNKEAMEKAHNLSMLVIDIVRNDYDDMLLHILNKFRDKNVTEPWNLQSDIFIQYKNLVKTNNSL